MTPPDQPAPPSCAYCRRAERHPHQPTPFEMEAEIRALRAKLAAAEQARDAAIARAEDLATLRESLTAIGLVPAAPIAGDDMHRTRSQRAESLTRALAAEERCRQFEAERDAARATGRRLNRRAQRAEARVRLLERREDITAELRSLAFDYRRRFQRAAAEAATARADASAARREREELRGELAGARAEVERLLAELHAVCDALGIDSDADAENPAGVAMRLAAEVERLRAGLSCVLGWVDVSVADARRAMKHIADGNHGAASYAAAHIVDRLHDVRLVPVVSRALASPPTADEPAYDRRPGDLAALHDARIAIGDDRDRPRTPDEQAYIDAGNWPARWEAALQLIDRLSAVVSPGRPTAGEPRETYRRYDAWGCTENEIGEPVDPKACMVCGCSEAEHAAWAARATAGEPVLRHEVATFAVAMERQLRANDHKPGWKGCDPGALLERLSEERDELLDEVTLSDASMGRGDRRTRILREAADVANFAMMVADVCGALTPTAGEPAAPSWCPRCLTRTDDPTEGKP